MEGFRSNSCNDESMQQIDSYNNNNNNNNNEAQNNPNTIPTGLQDLRCYSASYATSSSYANDVQMQKVSKEVKFKKGKSANGLTSKSWSFNDPELQRKKRVVSYKVYTVEGKVKGSIRKSFRWLKQRYTRMVRGWS